MTASPPAPLTDLDIRRIIREELSHAFKIHARPTFDDICYPYIKADPIFTGVYLPPPLTLAEIVKFTLLDYPHKMVSAKYLAELANVNYADYPRQSWAAEIARCEWKKLPSSLMTRHGTCAIYCRDCDAAELIMERAYKLYNHLPTEMRKVAI